jgi:hypothetical protein
MDMRIIRVVCLLFCCLISGCRHQDCPLHFNTTSYDFGRISYTDKPEYAFHFTNVSKRTVVIEDAQAGCACTLPDVSPKVIHSGESGVLRVRFEPIGYSGHVSKEITVQLDGFDHPIHFQIQADVNPLLQAVPREVDFGNVKPYMHPSKDIRIQNTSGQPVRIISIGTPSLFSARVVTQPSNGRDGVVSVSLSRPVLGTLYQYIYVHTSLATRDNIPVTVRAKVVSKWSMSRDDFYIGFVKKGSRPSASLTISNLSLDHIHRIWTDLQGISLQSAPAASEHGSEFHVALDTSSLNKGDIKGNVYIATTDSEEALITIPIVGTVQATN